jgi:hypothetical protein
MSISTRNRLDRNVNEIYIKNDISELRFNFSSDDGGTNFIY